MTDKLCANCQERPGTEIWVSEGGVLAFVHGMSQKWCKPCVLRAQLEYAREAAGRIPQLELELRQELAPARDEKTNTVNEWTCNKCSSAFEPTDSARRHRCHRCQACQRSYHRAWRGAPPGTPISGRPAYTEPERRVARLRTLRGIAARNKRPAPEPRLPFYPIVHQVYSRLVPPPARGSLALVMAWT